MSAHVGEVQPGSVMVYLPYQTRSDICDRYKHKQSIRLGVIQIIIGVLCSIFNSVCLGVLNHGFCFIGHGYWCGIVFMVTGIFGVIAGRRKMKCQIIAFMVLSIISAALTIALMFIGLIGAFVSHIFDDCPSDRHDPNIHDSPYCDKKLRLRTVMAMSLLLAISGLIEAIVAIWGSVLCCASFCCSSPMMVLPSVGYVPNTGQIVIDQTHAGRPDAAQPTLSHDQGLTAPPANVQPNWSMTTTNVGPMLGQPTFLYDQGTTPPPAYELPSWPMPTANIDPTHGQAPPAYMANQAQPEACFQKMGL